MEKSEEEMFLTELSQRIITSTEPSVVEFRKACKDFVEVIQK